MGVFMGGKMSDGKRWRDSGSILLWNFWRGVRKCWANKSGTQPGLRREEEQEGDGTAPCVEPYLLIFH